MLARIVLLLVCSLLGYGADIELGLGPNPNALTLIGGTWASPGTIGSTTPSSGAFTTLSATGAITSTLATGTAPFTVASTTQVTNLNASQLVGNTWTIPGTIGSGTPNTGAFTTLTSNGATTFTANVASTTTATGTVVITGGLGVSGQITGGSWSSAGSVFTAANLQTSAGRVITGASLATYMASGNCGMYRSGATITPTAGDLVFQSDAVGARGFYFAGGTSPATMMRLTGAGNFVLGAASAALATSATDGFIYMPTCAGTPSGAPTAFTGNAAFIYDTTAHKLWIYDPGTSAWRGVAF